MKNYLFVLITFISYTASAQDNRLNLVRYVDPMIGTHRMGHTYPGPTVPFGSVQLSPETDTIPYAVNGKYHPDVYKYCAGYQYDDQTITGFSHTHFSGTGHSDLGDILLMPTVGNVQLNPGTADHPEGGYRSRFSHDRERAEANYYEVFLDDYGVKAELTTTKRVGIHRYTFPKTDEAHLIMDLTAGIYNYDGKNVWTFVRVENDTLITGYRQTSGWARTRTVYFALTSSKPFKSYGAKDEKKTTVYRGFWGRFDQENNFPELAGRALKLHLDFDAAEGEQIQFKVALSPVSTAGALNNLRQEAPNWNFAEIKHKGQQLWQKELSKVEIKSISEEDNVNFYTAMYHAFINPTTYMDVDGKYKGLDQNVHEADGFTNYTTFSLWDTYRALHPLFNILQPKRNADMIQSMLAHYDQSVHNILPIWSHYANENWCMIGYHAVSLIADAIIKGNAPFDQEKALEACIASSNLRYYDGIPDYIKLGYVPEDKSGSSVSKTLEYAYDDWCIAQIAKKLNKTAVYEEYINRSKSYLNVYDASTGFMRPRMSDGSFRSDFDPLDTHGQGFIEGNAWNYSLYVPQYPEELIRLRGGKAQFAAHLDSLFTMHLPDKYFENTEDITRDGIIGNYVHGNEPSHHVAYLYNWTGHPWKTQERVRMIIDKMYNTGPAGLGGNDDTGQMSAWYLFTALGFYPVSPGSDEYILGSPNVKEATLNLENGNTFKITAVNQSKKNVYVQKIMLNGKELKGFVLKHQNLIEGGDLVFHMGSRPKK